MRENGQRRPAAAVLAGEALSGMLVCEEPTGSGWVASLYEQGTSEVLAKLFDVVLAREHEGVRLYQGIERGKQQTWLCTRSPERGWEILREMGAG